MTDQHVAIVTASIEATEQPDSPCQCTGPGWCATHKRCMPAAFVGACQTNPSAFDTLRRESRAGKYRDPMYRNCEGAPDRGLGDTIHGVAVKVGADKLAKRVARWLGRKDCGCHRRRRILNRIIPYK